MSQILVVDDEPAICWTLKSALEEEQHLVQTAGSAEEAFRLIAKFVPEVIVLDVRLPGQSGLTALESLRESHPEIPVIIMTAFGNLQTAVSAIQGGAFEYLTKPFDLDQALDVIARSLAKPDESPALIEQSSDPTLVLGNAPVVQEVYRQVAYAASLQVPVLLTGEKGTGKAQVAHAIHQHSDRANQPLIHLQPEILEHQTTETDQPDPLESLLSKANNGTLYLTEVDQLSPVHQDRIRQLMETETSPSQNIHTLNIRVIATSSKPLEPLAHNGTFDRDLYDRLSVMSISLPALREHTEDIALLAGHYIQQMQTQQKHSNSEVQLSAEAIAELQNRYWEGNLRELRNVIEHAVIQVRQGTLTAEDFPKAESQKLRHLELSDQIRETLLRWMQSVYQLEQADPTAGFLYEKFQADFESQLMPMVLELTDGNKQEAAALLGIHRQTLREKLKRFGLNKPS